LSTFALATLTQRVHRQLSAMFVLATPYSFAVFTPKVFVRGTDGTYMAPI